MVEVLSKIRNHSKKTEEFYFLVRNALPRFFECIIHSPDAIQVNTPLMYADGGIIEVYVVEDDNGILVTDFGEVLGWLNMTVGQTSRTPEQDRFVGKLCRQYRIEIDHDHLTQRLSSIESLSESVIFIAQAIARISDLRYTLPIRVNGSIVDDVQKWLSEHNLKFDREVERCGQSGQIWTVDYQTKIDDCVSFVFLLSPISKMVAKTVAKHALAGCVDLKHVTAKNQLVSLFNDTAAVWEPEDYELLKQQSIVARWSQPEELEKTLRGLNRK